MDSVSLLFGFVAQRAGLQVDQDAANEHATRHQVESGDVTASSVLQETCFMEIYKI